MKIDLTKSDNLLKIRELALNYGKEKLEDWSNVSNDGYVFLEHDAFVRAIGKSNDPKYDDYLYVYVYFLKILCQCRENCDYAILCSQENCQEEDCSESLILEAFYRPNGELDIEEHAYCGALNEEALNKAVWKSSEEETPEWVKLMELNKK